MLRIIFIWSLLWIPAILAGASFSDEVIADGPIGYYRLDESDGTVAEDSSGNLSHGAYLGKSLPLRGVSGFLADENTAMELSGSSIDGAYIRIPNLLNPALTSFTLEAVVQTDVIGTGQLIFQQLDVSGVGRSLVKINAGGEIDSFIAGSTRGSGISAEAGQPIHMALVFDRSGQAGSGEGEGTIIFYVDGVKGASISVSGVNGVEPSVGDFVIGISKGLNGQYFNGVIDEVVFYDKALPESRLVEHFQSMNQSSLIANFQASKRGVETGDSSILSWELEDGVTTLSMDAGIGNLDAEDGMVTVSPTETTEFTLTASDGVVSESRTVTVEVGAIGPYQLNEILSANAGPVVDEDGDESDWIEIANLGGVIGDLEGWYLTDDPALLTKWQFPSLEIAGGGYGLLFASGKDRQGSNGEAHTNFRLSRDGEYLALVEPDGVTIHDEFSPGFPSQQVGVSWGRGAGEMGYFVSPTPEAANGSAASAFVEEEVIASVTRGFFDDPFQVTLNTAAEEAEIYFTIDSSDPNPETGILYAGPIEITTTTALRAGAFRTGELPLKIMTQTYLFPEAILDQVDQPSGFPSVWQPSVTADYGMDDAAKIGTRAEIKGALRQLPTLSLVMDVDDWFNNSTNPGIGGLYANSTIARGSTWEKKISAEFFDFPHGREIQVDAGMRIFGNASRATSRKKHNMRLVFRSAYGPSKLEFPLFGDDGEDDVVNSYLLRGQNGDSWFHPTAAQREESLYIRDQLARSLQKEMGQPATKQDHIQLYINGLYWGVFNTIERIEADSMAQEYGGDKDEWDVMKASPPSSVVAEDGTPEAWQDLIALAKLDLATQENYEAVQQYLDPVNFIDWLLVNFYNGNSDWDHNNWQAGRRRGGDDKFRFFVWDSERTMLGETVNSTTKNNVDRPTWLHQQLRGNADYRALFADRVHRHFFNDGVLTPDSVERVFDSFVDELRVPLVGESARWGDAQRASEPYSVGDEWQTEVDFQKNTYLPNRSNTVLNQLKSQNLYPAIDAPIFGQFGGEVPVGYSLAMSLLGQEIHYTLDGSDPKDGGTIYVEEVILNESVEVKARTLSNGIWSALTHAAFYVGTVPASSANLVISELHYHPLSDDEGEEFVELMNIGAEAVDLRGVSFDDGIEFRFEEGTEETLRVIPPGGRVVLVGNEDDFLAVHDNGFAMVMGAMEGSLDNDGEQLVLRAADGEIIQDFTYNDQRPWPESADGLGYSLVLMNPSTGPDHGEASNWRRSVALDGNPGVGDAVGFVGDPDADSDGDGLTDFLEFALGNSVGEGSGVIRFEQGVEGLQLVFPARVGADGVRLVVEQSEDLMTWVPSDSFEEIDREAQGAEQELISLRGLALGETRGFVRLRVEVR
ncbi:CotH kinase family protein [Akkermansiaceae bacterium]|nr:CotH kinase family protein [Akkermansiaceae bacterium]MDB4820098.1 CotH kinase family protein [Akkermansiaceae bacterium]MDC0265083.1 CotH kinase family protein [bacterium]